MSLRSLCVHLGQTGPRGGQYKKQDSSCRIEYERIAEYPHSTSHIEWHTVGREILCCYREVDRGRFNPQEAHPKSIQATQRDTRT